MNPVPLVASPGTFNAAVAINAPGTNGISIPVLVTIQGVPALDVSPASLSFGYQLGTSAPAAETLTLSSSTGANVSLHRNRSNHQLRKLDRPESEQRRYAQHFKRASEHVRFDGRNMRGTNQHFRAWRLRTPMYRCQ